MSVEEKRYDPHVVIVWTATETAAVEFPNKEDAQEKYDLLMRSGAPKVVLAQVVRKHSEG